MRYTKKLRKQVCERDNYTCQLCGRQANHTHHIIYRSHGGKHIPENLICLCIACHETAHMNEPKYRDILIRLQQRHYPKLRKEDLK